MFRTACFAASMVVLTTAMRAQISSFPFTENFDQSGTPPAGWAMVGWTLSTTSSRSSPNCMSATGNQQVRIMVSPAVGFGSRLPHLLSFHERRTSTALRYRLAVWAVNDDSSIVRPLAIWDSAATANTYVERAVDLAIVEVPTAGSWRFVWEVLRDSTNSTGVLRIDDVRILAAPAVDVSPVRIELSDERPVAGNMIAVNVVVRNLGRSAADQATVALRWQERVGTFGSLTAAFRANALDSARVAFSVIVTQPGQLEITAISGAAQDENFTNDTTRIDVSVGLPPTALVVNEIQFDPVRESEPEWVEVYNPGPWTIPLSDVNISDNSMSRIALTNRSDEILTPGQFIVVARSEDFNSYYPATRYLLTAFPALNNTTPDAVVLRDVHGRTIDSAWYQPAWGMSGRSLERRDWNMTPWSADTWGPSNEPDGATPGRVNSIQRPEIDASCEGLIAVFHAGTMSLHLTALVRNRGRHTLNGGSVGWWLQPADSGLGEETPLGSTLFGLLPVSDSVAVDYRWTEVVRGPVRLRACVSVAGDARASNDTSWGSLLRPYAEGAVLVNEVMLEPLPGKPEWFEVVNVSPYPVDLSGWMAADLPSASGSRVRTTLPSSPSVLAPGRMAVIASDASIMDDYPWLAEGEALLTIAPRASGFGLNNDGDGIVLFDRTGQVIDSVVATRASHVDGLATAGRSLERRNLTRPALDASAWSSCSDPIGASPGRSNSVSIGVSTTAFNVRVEPDPFSPDGDSFEDVVQIRYESGAPSLFMDARIFDLSGREVRRLAGGEFVPANGSMSWNGRNDAGRVVPIGVYIVLLTATDAVSGRRESARALCSVAR
jgi:hypothetical protein